VRRALLAALSAPVHLRCLACGARVLYHPRP
jgi:DNA-directed RNA polymerase subunit RPC12/RpoP